MFVHWGHSSQQGLELSWPLVGGVFSLPFCSNIPVEQYHATAPQFNPQHYDPAAWAALAQQLGMQYVVDRKASRRLCPVPHPRVYVLDSTHPLRTRPCTAVCGGDASGWAARGVVLFAH